MITKFNYYVDAKGLVARKPDYSFTAVEELSSRLSGMDSELAITSIASTTLQGEAERPLIKLEDEWFKVQTSIQDMDAERVSLEAKLTSGNKSGNPLTADQQKVIAARIAELKPGTITVKKVFYNHYTRQSMEVDEVVQTPYTIAQLTRTDLEASNAYLAGMRGVAGTPTRPVAKLDAAKESEIRKELVRQKIDAIVGDDKDLIADISNTLSALLKKVAGQPVSTTEEASIAKYLKRQAEIATIMAADYVKK
jgi:hypothetical protein